MFNFVCDGFLHCCEVFVRNQTLHTCFDGALVQRDLFAQAQVQAQLTQYQLTHMGVDTNSKEWLAYASAVEEASKQTEDNRIKTEALKYDLENTFKNSIVQIELYKQKLQEMGADTTAVNAAIIQENQKFVRSYAQTLKLSAGSATARRRSSLSSRTMGRTQQRLYSMPSRPRSMG
jgi:cysteine sulfinate desulfinase/cysteine desulfurase-like protein